MRSLKDLPEITKNPHYAYTDTSDSVDKSKKTKIKIREILIIFTLIVAL